MTTITNDVTIRVLIVTMKRWWIGVSRLPMGLRQAGFEVAAWCPEESFIARSGGLTKHYPWDIHANWRRELLRIVEDWQPTVIIPADETVAAFLRKLALRPSWFNPGQKRLRRILRESLGDPNRTAALDGKIQLQRLARSLGIRTPNDQAASDLESAVALAEEIGYPVVLKDEFAAGGAGVKICPDAATLRAAWKDLDANQTAPSLKSKALSFLKPPFHWHVARRSVQRFIQGRPAFHAVVAWKGRRLGGVTAVVETSSPPGTGPSCVVRLTEIPEVSKACADLIRRTGMTGFAGFDFMIEESIGHAYILECNPRPTPVSHLGGMVGSDLCELFRDALLGRLPPEAGHYSERLLAFFPQELLRDPRSPYLGRAHLDFPQNDAPLLAAFLERYPELTAAMAVARPFLPSSAIQ